jgi:o-succinylbenzoate synthase
MKARFKKYILDFKRPSGTSRGVLTHKESWFIILEAEGKYGIGECGLLRGLSVDDVADYEDRLQWTCDHIRLGEAILWRKLMSYPSIQFGVEQAFLSLRSPDPFEIFPSDFTRNETPIAINGLIWMGEKEFMLTQIREKLANGFNCIKMKIGAVDFETELSILKAIRQKHGANEVQLRVDANGAFEPNEALDKLKLLYTLNLHSIEQPIKQGQIMEMAKLCSTTPLPIALDEELIGINNVTDKKKLLLTVQPQFIILKPSLLGGFKGCMEWIRLAKKYRIGWWITSALESNIGLNAIAQFTFGLDNSLPQGLGTGALYTNNFECPLTVENGKLYYKNDKIWKSNLIQELCT